MAMSGAGAGSVSPSPSGSVGSWRWLRAPRWRASSALLDNLEAVAVLVAEGEHGRHAIPMQDLVRVDAAGVQVGMEGIGVWCGEPDAGLDARWHALVGENECDRRFRPRWRDLDPALALAEGDVETGLEAEGVDVELQCSVLIGEGTPTVRTSVIRVRVVSVIALLRFVGYSN